MDQWLAKIYGTDDSDDLEKTAQAVLLQKLAEEEGIDLSGLSEEQLQELSDQILAEDQDDEDLDEQEILQKEAQAKFEEADFLGRVMAHAYTQELEKIAAEKGRGFKAVAKAYGRALAGEMGHRLSGGSTWKRRAASWGARAGTAAALAGAGHLIRKKMKKKQASAFDKLAEMRAEEMLDAVGITPEQQFENAVNQRALEMLADLGYDPEEIVDALS